LLTRVSMVIGPAIPNAVVSVARVRIACRNSPFEHRR
jgi:hypothetical protein